MVKKHNSKTSQGTDDRSDTMTGRITTDDICSERLTNLKRKFREGGEEAAYAYWVAFSSPSLSTSQLRAEEYAECYEARYSMG